MNNHWEFAVTLAAILIGTMYNRAGVDELRREMYREFKEFYRTIGQHDADIEALKKEKHS